MTWLTYSDVIRGFYLRVVCEELGEMMVTDIYICSRGCINIQTALIQQPVNATVYF